MKSFINDSKKQAKRPKFVHDDFKMAENQLKKKKKRSEITKCIQND